MKVFFLLYIGTSDAPGERLRRTRDQASEIVFGEYLLHCGAHSAVGLSERELSARGEQLFRTP